MKTKNFIYLLLILTSSRNEPDFYFGTWELNKENEVSTLILSNDKKLNWDFFGTRIFENMPFEAVKISTQRYDILAGQGNDCLKLTLQRLTDNMSIGYNYKCYINENMIDEVFIARKNGHPIEPIPKPEQETIILPNGYIGNFFIVYHNTNDNASNIIYINNKGIGINTGDPDVKQLFNANRSFKYEGQTNLIPILNPNDYTIIKHSNGVLDSIRNDTELVIIQKGFNQSGRNAWNKEYDENIKDNFNIEYFEIRLMKK
jgi:hypothetical protein